MHFNRRTDNDFGPLKQFGWIEQLVPYSLLSSQEQHPQLRALRRSAFKSVSHAAAD
jgi:hypothetical protein